MSKVIYLNNRRGWFYKSLRNMLEDIVILLQIGLKENLSIIFSQLINIA